MQLGHLSNDLQRKVWNAIHSCLGDPETFEVLDIYYSDSSIERIKKYYERIIGEIKKIPESQVPIRFGKKISLVNHISTRLIEPEKIFEDILMKEKVNEILYFVETVVNESLKETKTINRDAIFSLIRKIDILFNAYAAAYWLDTSQYPYQFRPRISKEQWEATQQAIETVRQGRMHSAATHLRQAVEHINLGNL